MAMPSDPRPEAEAPPGESDSLFAEARRHPVPTIALVLCIVAGAVLCGLFMPESISLPRRVAGGAVMGGMSWLLVMVGRLIGG